MPFHTASCGMPTFAEMILIGRSPVPHFQEGETDGSLSCLNCANVLKTEGFSANSPGPTSDFLNQDPRVVPQLLPHKRDHRLRDLVNQVFGL